MLVSVEVEPHHVAALERLSLLEPDTRDKGAIASAIASFLGYGTAHCCARGCVMAG
jgi:hypothetical protein